EGKITSQEIVKALRNVESDVDALFAKTDITIGQSLTLLNNEITKFVGEAGKGSGAAQVLVAAEGKITSQEIVKALRNVESDVDALFAKTDITIG
ncbi:tape measure protein, partial [Streptococcus agalactiae]|uniref:tape measure protein n=1 Tax=Streptococcus agalactiae TaxID=1311 RepID=UPI0015DA5BE4